MRFGRRVWGVSKVLLLTGSLVLTFLVFFVVSMRLAVRAGQVRVPDLAGRRVDEAARALAQIGLGLQIDENRRPDPKVPADRIMQQDPRAGVEARPQRTVRVWISAGPRMTRVPAITNQSERTARMRLEQDGLQLAAVTEVRSSVYPTDTVIAQEPPASSRAPRVAMLINRGEPAVGLVTPDVVGMDGGRVDAALRGQGILVTINAVQAYPGVPPGIVVRQQPAAGTRLMSTDTLLLEVSR
jgi:eukaryotic-like serine/threonine-protein kinase